MIYRTYRKNRPASAGLTLLELTASLAILVLLGGLVAVNFASLRWADELTNGATQLETAIRMTRATAAYRGRRFRLTFNADGTLAVLWEPRPLELPGDFVLYGATWFGRLPHTKARVVRCELTGDSDPALLALASGRHGQDEDLQPVTFYPDGSSDSALIELADPHDRSRRVIVELDGSNGRVCTHIVEESQVQDYWEQLAGDRSARS